MNHKTLSFLKSLIRIAASILALFWAIIPLAVGNDIIDFRCLALITLSVGYGGAEVLGILEEVFDKRKEE